MTRARTAMKARELLEPGALFKGVLFADLLARALPAHAPGERFGPFELVSELGRGGMGEVWLAERVEGGFAQRVALKLVQGRSDGVLGELFRREREILASLKHPHIARLLDGGRREEGTLWLAMELVEGLPIDRHVAERELDWRARIGLFLDVLDAVAAAHARLLIHCDIKPANVLVDRDGHAKLLDFGIAALAGQAGARAYTPGWESPEQLAGGEIGPASDQFQLGLLLLTLLLAGSPQPAQPLPEASAIACACTVSLARARELRSILARMLAAQPADRYGSVAEVADELRRWLDCRPVQAHGGGLRYALFCAVRRHPWTTLAVALVIAAGIGLVSYFNAQVAAERDRAEAERAVAVAINRFLNEDVLDAANPLRRAPGAPEPTLRQALDAAEARVSERFGGQPHVEVAVLATLARVRFEFGDLDRALALFDRAMETGKALPADHAARLDARLGHACILISEQRFGEAKDELLALLADVQAFQGARSALAYEVRLRLLEAESEQGARSDRVEDWRRLATEARAVLGPEHQVVGEAALGAAQALVFSGQAHRATEDARMAHRALSAALGPDHPTTLRALTAVAHGLRAAGDAQGALQAMANAHALQQARLGPDHPDTLFQLNEWAYTLTVLGHYEESAARFAELVERRRKDPQTPGFQLGQTLSNYAHARLRQGRVDAAVAAYREAVTAIARSAEAPASVRVSGWRGLADALRAAGQAQQAAQALEQAQQFAEQLPEGDPRRLGVDGTRALLLIDRGERAAGRALLDATIEQLAGKVAPDTPLLRTLIAEREALDAGG